ncbi:MAG: C40 family peptidase [Acidobacteriia bacterium]|nr:C40 family peptidase [Terriglobia bacterium]
MHVVIPMALLAASVTGGVILKPVANMYSRPSEDADVVSQAIFGSNVAIIEDQAGWVRVRTADEYTGWTLAASLRRLGSGDRPYGSSGRVARVARLFANLYREPDVTKHQPVYTVPFETNLEVIRAESETGRWLEVRLPDDRPAWVQTGDVTLDSKPLGIRELIAFSKQFLGLPYLWGGTSTFGFDCSGFTQMLCRRRGIIIPRDANVQAKWQGAEAVDRKQLEPGDLLFFGESKITHTGMYIGNGMFINATTHERPVVQISDLSDPFWEKLFLAARRIK